MQVFYAVESTTNPFYGMTIGNIDLNCIEKSDNVEKRIWETLSNSGNFGREVF